MPIPDTTRQRHHPVVEGKRLVAVDLGDAAQAFGPADGVFDLDAAAGVGGIVGSLDVGQGGVRAFFATPGLAVGQAFGRQVVIGDQAQIAQIDQ